MVRWIIISVLSLSIIGTAVWGYQEHQEKNAILIQAENTYQRAFHELSYHVDLLHDKIGSSLAMNTKEQLSPQLVEIWRLTSEAHANVGQLPLGLLPFNKTEEFLSKIGDFTYRTAVRDLENDPLSDKEIESLENLYEQSNEIKDELRLVQHLALKNNLRWMDVQLALATQDENMDNTIIDGFKTVEKAVEGYAEANTDSTLMDQEEANPSYTFLSEEIITENEALKNGGKLFSVDNENDLSIEKSGEGADVPLYSISYRNDKKNAYMDMTQNGGHPISLLVDRPLNKKEISLNEGFERAKQYLKEYGFEGMEMYQSSEYNNIGVYSFVYNENGVHIYSDAIEVKVALDNGDILGFTAKNYLMNHREREIPEPKLTEDEARQMVNANIDIQDQSLAVITNDLGKETLVYEYLGILGNDTYRIFINASDGMEEKVEKLSGAEINFEAS